MKENWLEKGLQEKLNDYNSLMDLEGAWNALEDTREPPKKNRKFFIWWILGLSTLAISMTYLLSTPTEPENSEIYNSSVDISEETKNFKDIKELGFNKIATLESKNNLRSAAKHLDNNEKHSILNTSSFDSYQVKANEIVNKTQKLASKVFRRDNSKITITNKSNFASENIRYDKSNINNEYRNVDLVNSNYVNTALILSTSEISRPLSYLVIPQATLFKGQDKILKPYLTRRISDNEDNDKYVKLLTQTFGIGGGYGLSSKGKVLDEESPLDNLTLQINYQRFLSRNFYIKTGVYLDQYTNKISSINTSSYVGSLDDQTIIINSYQDGSTEEIKGSVDVDIKETTSYLIYNQYQFISIPIIFGIEVFNINNSSFQFEGGLSTTIASRYDVKFWSSEDRQVISSLEDTDLSQYGLFRGLYTVQWNYQISNATDWGVFVKYQGQYQLNDISSNIELNLEKFNAHQFLIGLKYQL